MIFKIYIILSLTILINSCQMKGVVLDKNHQHIYTQESLKNLVKKTHIDKFRWMVQRQMDSLSNILHEDMYYIHSNGWKENKRELLQNIESRKLEYIDVQIQESETRIVGETGIVTGKAIFKVSLEQRPIEINLFYTEVYSLLDGKVVLLSRHACKL